MQYYFNVSKVFISWDSPLESFSCDIYLAVILIPNQFLGVPFDSWLILRFLNYYFILSRYIRHFWFSDLVKVFQRKSYCFFFLYLPLSRPLFLQGFFIGYLRLFLVAYLKVIIGHWIQDQSKCILYLKLLWTQDIPVEQFGKIRAPRTQYSWPFSKPFEIGTAVKNHYTPSFNPSFIE